MGRAMERVIAVARECGYLQGLPPFLGPDLFDRLPRDKVLALATGSQGDRARRSPAWPRISIPARHLAPGDRVIFSSRTIPGNEKAVGRVINGLVEQDVDVVTDRTHLVHVSGHPRRAEMARMYDWTRPKIAIPAHGEQLHLTVHVTFAKSRGVKEVVRAFDGDVVAIEEGRAALIDRVATGGVTRTATSCCRRGRVRRRAAPPGGLGGRLDCARDLGQGRSGRRSRRDHRRPAAADARRRRARRNRRFSDIRDGRGLAARKTPRHRFRLRRRRARGAQLHQFGLGQAADRACARRRSLRER